ncbi:MULTISPECIES: hypothetical protein [unclassified Streptomyces]|nr:MULTISPECIES: hypothetical protein [unclassified Streptomyces]
MLAGEVQVRAVATATSAASGRLNEVSSTLDFASVREEARGFLES